MTNILFILNDPPYGTGRSHNALRIVSLLSRHAGNYVRVSLVGDAIQCATERAKDGTPQYDTISFAWDKLTDYSSSEGGAVTSRAA